MVQLSIVIIAWNAQQYLRECLDSVFESTREYAREILVVDNGSTDATSGILQEYKSHPALQIITLPTNRGVAGGRNSGLRKARGKYVWFLDVDTIINKESVSALFHYMELHPECGICGCKLVNGQGEVQDSCRKLPSFAHKIKNVLSSIAGRSSLFRFLKEKIDVMNHSQFYRDQMQGKEPFEVEYLIGACQFIRREVIEQIGTLDENIFYGPEDADYCLRACSKNWKIVYLPFVSFIHEYQQVTNRKLVSKMGWIHLQSLCYFFVKHKRF